MRNDAARLVKELDALLAPYSGFSGAHKRAIKIGSLRTIRSVLAALSSTASNAGIAAAAKRLLMHFTDAGLHTARVDLPLDHQQEAVAALRAALSVSNETPSEGVIEDAACSAYERGYRDGHEDCNDPLIDGPLDMLVRECVPEGFAQWKADNPALLNRALPFPTDAMLEEVGE